MMTLLLLDGLTDEDQFICVIQAIINKDEVLRIIRGIASFACGKEASQDSSQ